jgi:hypothetical protein
MYLIGTFDLPRPAWTCLDHQVGCIGQRGQRSMFRDFAWRSWQHGF